MTENQTNLLIVEDDVDLAEMLSAYFSVQGYNIAVSSWGEDALPLARKNKPDIILLDIRLPDIDGYEVCRRLRAERSLKNVPVIFLTEKRERSDKLAGLQLGAVDYITKPFDIQELRLRVRNALRRKQSHSFNNPITKMPESTSVQEKLEQLLHNRSWGLVFAGITGLSNFRNQYGFVAADDVIRAISLIITTVMKEHGIEDHFAGHVDEVSFVIITGKENYREIAEDCYNRLQSSIQYFYPAIDRSQIKKSVALTTQVAILSAADGPFANVDALRKQLSARKSQLTR